MDIDRGQDPGSVVLTIGVQRAGSFGLGGSEVLGRDRFTHARLPRMIARVTLRPDRMWRLPTLPRAGRGAALRCAALCCAVLRCAALSSA